MGQKVNPIGLRVGINRTWDSHWYAKRDFANAGGCGLITEDASKIGVHKANLLAAAHKGPLEGDIFNIATGTSPSVLELHEKMAAAFGMPDAKPTFLAERRGDITWSRADIAHARKILGYNPLVSFEDGLRATVEWYKSRPRSKAAA